MRLVSLIRIDALSPSEGRSRVRFIVSLSLMAFSLGLGPPGHAGDVRVTVEFDGGASYRFSRPERRQIKAIAERTLVEVRELLPSLGPKLKLTVTAGSRVIPEIGSVGAAVAPGVITWTVDPDRPEGVDGVAANHLRPTLFHELHHQARGWVMQGGKPRTTFMEAVVSEGLATAFERDAAGSQPLWGQYSEEVEDWVDELKALSAAEGFGDYGRWMFQHPDGRRWIGYRAGTYIADRAIANSGKSAAELLKTSVDELLDLAGMARDEDRR